MDFFGSDNQALIEQISQIASNFQLFECVACAEAIKKFLTQRGIRGKQIKLYTGKAKGKYGNIYHDGLKRNIATNGRHEGILVEIAGQEIVFDNIHYEGLTREAWIANFYCLAMDLGGEFEITEVEF